MKHIVEGRVLIVADIHQNLGYAKACLDLEVYDRVVFLGDWLDTFAKIDNETWYGVGKTCEYINYLFEKLGDKAVWCVGNHDIAYFASHLPKTFRVRDPYFYKCSGWTKSKASEFNKAIDPQWIEANKLCCKVGDYVISHAGFHYNHFVPHHTEEQNIKSLHRRWEDDKQHFYQEPYHPIWDVGQKRKGHSLVGSPVWLDWGSEFVELDHTKQIVGHSSYVSPENEVKTKGENYNIDSMQSCYAIWDNGKLQIKWTKAPEKQ